jgi:hypothetical protein
VPAKISKRWFQAKGNPGLSIGVAECGEADGQGGISKGPMCLMVFAQGIALFHPEKLQLLII